MNSKKLVESAQVRKQNVVLQHGTLPLYGDISRITQVLNLDSLEQRELLKDKLWNQATSLESVLGLRVTFFEAAECLR